MTTATATLTPATPAQIREVQRLIVRLEVLGQDMIDTRKRLNDCWAVNQLDDVMLTLATEVLTKRITNLETAPDRRAVPTGRYAVLTEAGHYAFYRVWVGDRATLVFLITSDEETRCPRQTAPAILSKILAYGVLEASKAYGREIGVCGVCNTIPSGRYAVRTGNAPDAPYAFYRVWKGDRATLVFLQISDDQQRLSRPAANGVLRKIGFDVKEAACAYGREIGVCGVCNRTLTDPDSIALGIGPVCATRL